MAHVVQQTNDFGKQNKPDPGAEPVDTTRKCATLLIPDDPSGADAFGAHDTVAEAIADLINGKDIQTGNTPSGKAIGIEGSWGSGKTTVIELLRRRMMKDKGCAFFVFDAWAHEGDPLRRTFLESLIDHFIGLGWFRESDWANDKKVIQRQLEMKSTRTIPQFTVLGIVVLLSVALIPIGNAIVGSELRDGRVTLNPTLNFAPRFLFGLALLTLPALIILASWAALMLFRGSRWSYYKIRELITKKEIPERSQSSIVEGTIWAMLLNKALS